MTSEYRKNKSKKCTYVCYVRGSETIANLMAQQKYKNTCPPPKKKKKRDKNKTDKICAKLEITLKEVSEYINQLKLKL